ncbi:Pre-mRNA-splicing factor SYF2 [Entomophthora muscae]|uniref:Pre-mRNA-splicing factor SYF2 n=1 Tax=Entomophthora muscae TaxID=34485 RepID=A0ACC2TFU8_9FUNG|nr:Pre-mRNA-splicing factor SYF2 [Entomophthora muscae]
MSSKARKTKRSRKEAEIETAAEDTMAPKAGAESGQAPAVSVADRLQKLKELRKRMVVQLEALKLTFKRMSRQMRIGKKYLLSTNARKQIPNSIAKIEKKTLEAERLQARLDAADRGEDYERSRFWGYSAEAAEKWEAREEERIKRSEIGFTDFNQVAEKKYNKNINKLKPNLGIYETQKKSYEAGLANEPSLELAVASQVSKDGRTIRFNAIHPKPSSEAVDRLVSHVKDEIAERAKFSKTRPVKEEDDVTYINDRNAHFNRKISRAFDKYTKEIKDSFERGTAL